MPEPNWKFKFAELNAKWNRLQESIRQNTLSAPPEDRYKRLWTELKEWVLNRYDDVSHAEIVSKMRQLESQGTDVSGKERDYTPEEALAEARRRWGSDAIVNVDMDTDGEKYTGVIYWVSPEPETQEFIGNSFRACFAEASRVSGKEEK